MLGEVLLELGDQGFLVGLELLAIVRRQVDGVLVRRVHARDGDHPVVVHLLGELARQLDRLHVCTEGATEDAFEQGLDLRLNGAEHGYRRGCFPGQRV